MARTLEEIRASRPVVDHEKIRATTEEDIQRYAMEDDSLPAAPLSEFVLKRGPGQRGAGKKTAKVQIAIRFDADALAAWKSTGPGWQGRINELVVREAPKVKRSTRIA